MINKTIVIMLLSCVSYAQTTWNHIDEGFDIGVYQSPELSIMGNSKLTILKIDPEGYDFNLFSENTRPKTANVWAKSRNLIAVVNAGMYDINGTNMGFMMQYGSLFSPKMNSDNAILAFNPKDDTVPSVQIIDMKNNDWTTLSQKYNSFTQSIRMVDLYGQNMWGESERMWSVVVVAMTKDDNVLFIHCRSPYQMKNFIDILKESDLNIRNVMYLEGGPEASLYVNHCNTEISLMGSYETGFFDDSNNEFWNIPNVIGITKKK
jgi:uncharacterized protein YigE (DUF2233 family)